MLTWDANPGRLRAGLNNFDTLDMVSKNGIKKIGIESTNWPVVSSAQGESRAVFNAVFKKYQQRKKTVYFEVERDQRKH